MKHALMLICALLMIPEQYDEALRRVRAVASDWPPHGLVIDIWSSRAQFDQFGQWLKPLPEHVGVHLIDARVSEIHSAFRS